MFLPFHVYWDSPGADVQDKGMQKLPLGKGSAKLLRCNIRTAATRLEIPGTYTSGLTIESRRWSIIGVPQKARCRVSL